MQQRIRTPWLFWGPFWGKGWEGVEGPIIYLFGRSTSDAVWTEKYDMYFRTTSPQYRTKTAALGEVTFVRSAEVSKRGCPPSSSPSGVEDFQISPSYLGDIAKDKASTISRLFRGESWLQFVHLQGDRRLGLTKNEPGPSKQRLASNHKKPGRTCNVGEASTPIGRHILTLP